ncbi:hypothetical protein Micbo1qcDRAFT_202773 [Microdochium bolleyi]|uniref:Heterokaryon incompatibility domain-containing protein n=1 Tax=Microdochium bolleyi TaxID=196109 RepID=A0A136J5W8_9PEZI|nr:hypothetical protein Micbo1qcDRAFT_202773 [Microdochium bolleyi]
MRLLTTGADGRVTIAGPYRKHVPRYAILSHRRDPEEGEVTLQDLLGGNAQARPDLRKRADRYYVYLEDVPCGEDTGAWEPLLRSSEWLRRGWTLQELIAPASVEFFARDGLFLGNKMKLAELISWRWVRTRTTTVEEDMVYCMLGLLEVSMPVKYGEGYSDAVLRLDDILDRNHGTKVSGGVSSYTRGGNARLSENETGTPTF